MSVFDLYLKQVFRGTYLRKSEKRIWMEEMRGHLDEAADRYRQTGRTDEEAQALAIKRFGSSKAVRRDVVRAVFGISPHWYMAAAIISFVSLGLALFVNMRAFDIIPSTMTPISTPVWVLFLHQHFPMSCSAWAGLTVLFIMLLYTRSIRDRLAVCLSSSPFIADWLFVRLSHQRTVGGTFWGDPQYSMMQPLLWTVIGIFVWLMWCFVLYVWTRNRLVSLTPLWMSMALVLWPILRNAVQSLLYQWTGNPIFWGHGFPYSVQSWMPILLRIILGAVFLWGCKRIDMRYERKLNHV